MMPHDQACRMLTAQELAAEWGVPVTTIWALARRKAIPFVVLGRLYRFPRAAIVAFEAASGNLSAARHGSHGAAA